MSQIRDFPPREHPYFDDFLYLITQGNTDYKVLISQLMGETINPIIESNYEIIQDDRYKTIRMTFINAKELTVPVEEDVDWVDGTWCIVRNASPANLNLIPATAAVDLNTKSGLVIVPYGEAKLTYVGQNTWDCIGDLSA